MVINEKNQHWYNLTNPFSTYNTLGLVKIIRTPTALDALNLLVISKMIKQRTQNYDQSHFSYLKALNFDIETNVSYKSGSDFVQLTWLINYVPSLVDYQQLISLIDEFINNLYIDEDLFKQVKENLILEYQNLFDNPQSYVKELVIPSLFTNKFYPQQCLDYLKQLTYEKIVPLFDVISQTPWSLRYDCGKDENSFVNVAALDWQHVEVNHYQKQQERDDVIIELNNKQANLILNYEFSAPFSQQQLQVFNTVFGNGADSLLFKIVREQHHLCYSVNSQIIDNQILSIYVGCDLDKVDQAINIIDDIIQQLQTNEIDYNLADTKNQLTQRINQLSNDFAYHVRQVINHVLFGYVYKPKEQLVLINEVDEEVIRAISNSLVYVNQILIK